MTDIARRHRRHSDSRSRGSRAGLILAACAALLTSALAPASAGATIPIGNLLGNPGGDLDQGVTNATEHPCPVFWKCVVGFPTAVRYTAGGGFPTTAQAPPGGDKNFFAGGPLHPPPDADAADMWQDFNLAALVEDVVAGRAQATVSGWLGGFENQADRAEIRLTLYSDAPGVGTVGQATTGNVTAGERGLATGFRFRTGTTTVPAMARFARLTATFRRDIAAGPYNDGYADNLRLCFSRVGTDPARACSPPASGGGGSTPAPSNGGRTILGGAGDTTLRGTPGDDVILCGDGDDTVLAGGGDDFIDCKGGDDRIRAGSGDDVVRAGAGRDRVRGGAGEDRVRGQAGRDRLGGGSGPDRLSGGTGRDRLFGNSGKDRLRGGPGRDRLFGGSGRDVLLGGPGRDLLRGGAGRDRVRR